MKYSFEKNIVFEDNHLLIVNKESGQLSQGDKTGDQTVCDLYKKYIKEKYNKPGNVFLHPAHRLDRPVSGLLVLAKTSKALSRMTVLFKDRKVKKTYIAISHKLPNEFSGVLTDFIEKNTKKNRVRIIEPTGKVNKSKKAILKYKVIKWDNGQSVFLVNPTTGRPHQIRVQLAKIGCPIIGDSKYGGNKNPNGQQIGLHCIKMSFIHPVSKELLNLNCDFKNNSCFSLLNFNEIGDLLRELGDKV